MLCNNLVVSVLFRAFLFDEMLRKRTNFASSATSLLARFSRWNRTFFTMLRDRRRRGLQHQKERYEIGRILPLNENSIPSNFSLPLSLSSLFIL